MKIELNIEKRHLLFLILALCVFFVAGVSAYQSGQAPDVFGHSGDEIANISAGKILAGIFSAQETNPVFTFPYDLNVNNLLKTKNINVTGNMTLGGKERNSWPSGCNWTGWKCKCDRDPSGTQGKVTLGLKCFNGEIVDFDLIVIVTTGSTSCTRPNWCDIWQ